VETTGASDVVATHDPGPCDGEQDARCEMDRRVSARPCLVTRPVGGAGQARGAGVPRPGLLGLRPRSGTHPQGVFPRPRSRDRTVMRLPYRVRV
jgi:hypothetical protein